MRGRCLAMISLGALASPCAGAVVVAPPSPASPAALVAVLASAAAGVLAWFTWRAWRRRRALWACAQSLDRLATAGEPPALAPAVPAELRPLADALTRLVARVESERTDHLRQLHEARIEALGQHAQADAALRAKARFLATAGHDLRQPLHAMGMALQTLRLGQDPGHAAVDQLALGLSEIGTLLDNLLELSRLEARLVKPRTAGVALSDVLTRVEARLGDANGGSGTRVYWRPGTARVHSDPEMLAGLLEKLVRNAMAAAPGGRILVAARRRGGAIRLEVRDNGIGISRLHHERIFDEFFQVDNPGSDRRKGVGLGLAICKQIAALMEIQLELRSELKRGSCFSLTLPADPGHPPAPARQPRLHSAAGLLVDWDRERRWQMASLLRGWGHRLEVASSLGQAMARLQARQPLDFVLVYAAASADEVRTLAHATHARRDRPQLIVAWDAAGHAGAPAGSRVLDLPVPPARLRALVSRPPARMSPRP